MADLHQGQETDVNTASTSDTINSPSKNIAGFWRRGLAFTLDAALLVAAGTALGFAFMEQLAALGPWGRALGFTVSVLYFGLGESLLTRGASPGKRLLGLMVLNQKGEPVSILRSFVRSTIFLIPVMLDARCLTCPAALEIALGAMVYGGGGAMLALIVINRQTRQTVHDLATGTFVVKASAQPARPVGTAPGAPVPGHYMIAGAVALLITVFIIIATQDEVKSGRRPVMAQVVRVLSAEPGVASVHALSGELVIKRRPEKFLQITVRLSQRQEAGLEAGLEGKANQLVRVAMREVPTAFEVKNVGVKVSFGYDIGIGVRYRTFDRYDTPAGWRQRSGP